MKLTHTEGRIIVSVDMNYKNSHTFTDGTKISLERKYDNFDQKYTQPVNAIVISAENIPEGSEIIIHHNCTHETNRINNYKALSGEDIAADVRYFSIKVTEAFAWRNGAKWQPLPGFDFALRIFKPYFGVIEGIEPTLIKNILWITTGEYKGNAVVTLKHCDYQLIFQDINGREANLIRLRSAENVEEQRECEIIALHNDYTEKILNGQLHVGLTKSDANSLNKLQLK
jgi:hypothetical protein